LGSPNVPTSWGLTPWRGGGAFVAGAPKAAQRARVRPASAYGPWAPSSCTRRLTRSGRLGSSHFGPRSPLLCLQSSRRRARLGRPCLPRRRCPRPPHHFGLVGPPVSAVERAVGVAARGHARVVLDRLCVVSGVPPTMLSSPVFVSPSGGRVSAQAAPNRAIRGKNEIGRRMTDRVLKSHLAITREATRAKVGAAAVLPVAFSTRGCTRPTRMTRGEARGGAGTTPTKLA
jgi:hypothetical protein